MKNVLKMQQIQVQLKPLEYYDIHKMFQVIGTIKYPITFNAFDTQVAAMKPSKHVANTR